MRIGELAKPELHRRLRDEGLMIQTGDFAVRICSSLEQIAQGIGVLYADHEVFSERLFNDCHIRVSFARGLRKYFSKPTRLIVNGNEWYRAERGLEMACMEWGMNWFVFRHAHHMLVIHAGTLERDGLGLLMPAHSGSGKSTLTAALAHSGWRLFSDELGLIQPDTGELHSLARPICLKGDSIRTIREFAPHARFGPTVYHRQEQRHISHVKPPKDSVERMAERTAPRIILFPQYSAGSQTMLTEVSPSDSFIRLAQASFNYSKLHRRGFETFQKIIDQCHAYELTYSNLHEAVELIGQIASEMAPLVQHA